MAHRFIIIAWCVGALLSDAPRLFAQDPPVVNVEPLIYRPPENKTLNQPEVKQAQVQSCCRPDRAVAMMLADLHALAKSNPLLPPRMRYIMANVVTETTRAGLSLAANNAFLLTSEPYRVVPIGDGSVFRVDLAEFYGHDAKKIILAFHTWDRMQDPQFYLVTDKKKLFHSIPYRIKGDPKRYTAVYAPELVPAAHVGVELLIEAQKLTNCMVPIISAGQFMRYTMNSDFGGLYPEFRQFDLAPEKGTVEAALIARCGVVVDDLTERNADKRVVCFRNPTGQPGFIEYYPAAGTSAEVGPAMLTITRDFFAGFIGNGVHPYENLADRKHDGSELFIPTPAGGLDFVLADAAGNFVRSAPLQPPDNSLAADRTIPSPWHPILQAPSGCIRCHTKENPETRAYAIYQPAPNLISWLLEINANGIRWDVLKNLSNKEIHAQVKDKKLARLVTLVKGEINNAFGWAGRTYATYVFNASGLPFEEACQAMFDIHDEWLYSFVEPVDAVAMLGYQVETNAAAVELFDQICPMVVEPLRVSQIRAWREDRRVKIPIDDWLAVYPEIALRVMLHEQQQAAASVPNPMSGEKK